MVVLDTHAWELFMLESKNRLRLGIPVEVWIRRCEGLSFLQFIPVDYEVARLSVGKCGMIHSSRRSFPEAGLDEAAVGERRRTEHEGEDEDEDADADRAVGDVECGPVMRRHIEVKEVDD